MGTLAVDADTYDNLTVRRRTILAAAFDKLALGHPATYVDQDGTRWHVWDDPRISLHDIATVGTIAANLPRIDRMGGLTVDTDDGTIRLHPEARRRLREGLAQQLDRIDQAAVGEADDPWREVLTQVDAPPVVRAAAGLPDGLSPKPPGD